MKNEQLISYLNTLPEPYKTQAIDNYDETLYKGNNIRNLNHALNWAFEWRNSPQGFKYWSDFTDSLPNIVDEFDVYNLDIAGKD